MATSQSTMDYLLDQLSDSREVSARKMFGEYCLYYAGRPVGLVCDEQLFLKQTPAGQRLMKDADMGAPFPGARPHLRIAPDHWEDRPWLNQLVRATFDSLPPPKLPRPRVALVGEAATLSDLPNLGPKSKDMLAAVQIKTVTQLRTLGAVAAFAKVKQHDARASLNLLWALEGALTGLPWQTVAHEHRTSLLLALEQHLAEQPAAPVRKPRSKGTS